MTKDKKGYALWKKSIKVIPGGNGLLSKRPERYAGEYWPTYFEKALGINLYDLSGNKWKDFAQMGLGCAILGYNNAEVNRYVSKFINKGINTTLNCPEEYILAKKLVKLNSFAKYVKYSRTGGEAMAIAVRIARAKTSTTSLAFSGYHGWHDWYIASNLQNRNNLDEQLLPGLKTNGVPKELIKTAFPFKYNSLSSLKKVLKLNRNIKIIIIEGARKSLLKQEIVKYLNYLKKNKNFVIIVDEITSGLRTSCSGAFKKTKLNPNIAVYGKALGNGFAINAIVGDEIMDCAQDTFISSSFHTERVGFVAAIKTLEILERDKIWINLDLMGKFLLKGINKIAKKYDIKIKTNDFFPLPSYDFNYKDQNSAYHTFFIQEFLKKGYLTSGSIYLSSKHNKKEIEKYLFHFDKIAFKLKKILEKNEDIKKYLKIPIIDTGFKRLT